MLGFLTRKKDSAQAELEDLVGSFELPSFPVIVNDALSLLRDEDSSLKSIGELLLKDPGLTTRILGSVNSAQFSLRQPVRNVQHAIQLLGRGEVESMLISVAVRQSLPSDPAPGFEARRFWSTSAHRAAAAAALAERISPGSRSETFTAALLQDMALPVLARQKEDYGRILQAWHTTDAELNVIEADEFGWDHGLVAGYMCKRWGFPEKLLDAIALHHEPPIISASADNPLDELSGVKLVAVFREAQAEIGFARFAQLCAQHASLTEEEAHQIVDDTHDASDELARTFS